MRYIVFRGKLSDGRWSEGNLAVHKDGVCIITPDATPVGRYGQVDPDTVGQYTGLTDTNGKCIFEGDIVKCFESIGQIVFAAGCFAVYFINGINWASIENELHNQLYACYNDNIISLWEIVWNFEESDSCCCDHIEVIGNIHDNADLLTAIVKDE